MTDFDSTSCEIDNFTFKVLYLKCFIFKFKVILYYYYIKAKQNHNTLKRFLLLL